MADEDAPTRADALPPEPVDPHDADAAEVTAKRSLADRIGLVVGSNFVTAGVGMAQGLLLVRLLSKPDYGAWSFAMMLFGTGRDLGLFAVPDSILYFAPKITPSETRGLVRQSMRLLLGLALVVGAIFAALALAPHAFLDGRRGLGTVMLLLATATLFLFPSSVYASAFIATDNHRAAAGVNTLLTFTQTLGLVIPAALGVRLEILVAIYAANAGLKLVLLEIVFRRVFAGTKTAPFPGGVRAQLRYAGPLAMTKFAGIFNKQLDKFVVGLFFSAAAFADFAVGATELPLVSILPYSIASLMLPKLVELVEKGTTRTEGARDAVKLWHAGIDKATIVMLPIAGFLLVEAVPFVEVLYGSKYQAAALPFRIYTSLLPLRVTAYGMMLLAFGQSGQILRVQIYGMFVNVAACFALLPLLGMIGAPIAAIGTQMFMIVYLLMRIDAVAEVGVRGIFPYRFYGKTALAVLGALVPLIAARAIPGVRALGVPAPIELAVAAVVFIALYLALADRAGVLGAEDKAFVGRWLRLEPLRSKRAPAAQPLA
jgi:O-antigen/teichoic acid export membrane protein